MYSVARSYIKGTYGRAIVSLGDQEAGGLFRETVEAVIHRKVGGIGCSYCSHLFDQVAEWLLSDSGPDLISFQKLFRAAFISLRK